jgi:uncharacterized membrane protein
MTRDPLYILAVLCLLIVMSEWLVRRTFLRHVGTALLVILVTAVLANLGLLPTASTEESPVPVYDAIFGVVAYVAIFWLLLRVNLGELKKAGLPIIVLFLIGAAGTFLGAWVGMAAIGGRQVLGPLHGAVGGMFVGTYIGGSINFNAIALMYDVQREAVLFAGAVAVDNVITTLWMIATIALPRLLLPLWRRPAAARTAHTTHTAATAAPTGPAAHAAPAAPATPAAPTGPAAHAAPRADVITGVEDDTESVHPQDVALLLALGLGMLWLSHRLSAWIDAATGVSIHAILLITALALVLAQVPAISRLRGTRVLGMFAVYLFLAAIGALADVRALAQLGRLGVVLLAFAGILVLVHGTITFVAARLLRFDLDMAAVASQANIGGGTSALALARSLGRGDLVLPAVLIGSLGNAIGTFLGAWFAAGWV